MSQSTLLAEDDALVSAVRQLRQAQEQTNEPAHSVLGRAAVPSTRPKRTSAPELQRTRTFGGLIFRFSHGEHQRTRHDSRERLAARGGIAC
jgi:hypothetical protein